MTFFLTSLQLPSELNSETFTLFPHFHVLLSLELHFFLDTVILDLRCSGYDWDFKLLLSDLRLSGLSSALCTAFVSTFFLNFILIIDLGEDQELGDSDLLPFFSLDSYYSTGQAFNI